MKTGGGAIESTRATIGFRLPTEAWAVDAARLRHVTETLDGLPIGFAVFHGVSLPRPSTEVVDHVVIGPRSVWAVTVATFEEPVTVGSGRGADTLWAGRRSLRSVLEASESRAETLAGEIGYPVEPLLCISAPSIEAGACEVQAITVCSPDDLAAAVAASTTSWHDVNVLASAVADHFGVEPARRSNVPTLHQPVLPSTRRRPHPAERVGWVSRRVRRAMPARLVVPMFVLAVALVAVPNLFGIGSSVAQRGVEIGVDSVSDVLTPSTLVTEAAEREPVGAPPDVRYVVSCPNPGAGWTVGWVWPGDLPDGAASYGVRTRAADGAVRNRTSAAWTSATQEQTSVNVDTTAGDVVVITEYRDRAGAVLSASASVFRAPAGTC